jgi:Protein of unknown function (DUF2934)
MSTKRKSDKELVVSPGGAAAAPSRRNPSSRSRSQRPAPPAEIVESLNSEPQIAQPVQVTPLPVYEPTHEAIAALAYSYWEARGYQGGSPEQDWLRAEQELRTSCSAAASA